MMQAKTEQSTVARLLFLLLLMDPARHPIPFMTRYSYTHTCQLILFRARSLKNAALIYPLELQ